MQELGNVLTIGGILVTLVAYLGQHSGVTLGDLEPGLVQRWSTSRAWFRRKLGRTSDRVILVQGAAGRARGGSVVVWSWKPINSEDDLDTRVEALTQNVEQLRKNLTELREMDTKHFRNVTTGLSTRLADLKRLVDERHAQSRRETTAAMRWEVRGLLITLIGAGMSALG